MSKRVNIMVTEKTEAQLAQLTAEEESTTSEVIRRSVQLYSSLKEMRKDKSKLIVKREDGTLLELIIV